MRFCKECKQMKELNDFQINNTFINKIAYKHKCKSCRNTESKVRRTLHKQNAKPLPGKCPICERHTEKWVLDHDHVQNTFRGWLCNCCNTSLGKFNDDINILNNAINYLKTSI